MSHAATNWAFQQRGLKPATKIVLFYLCDRYHPDNGCFPSQDTLSNDCEMSRSSLNDHLITLENAGLIAREQRRRKGSMQQDRTHYRFAFEPGFVPVSEGKPCPEFGHGSDGEAVSGKAAEPCPGNGESRVRNSDSNPVREPVIEPVIERERASEASGKKDEAGESREAIRRAFNKWYRTWPANASIPHTAEEAWFELTRDERAECIDRTHDYIEWCGGPKKISTYAAVFLRGKMWQKLPPKITPLNRPEEAKPFGRASMAYRFSELLKPEVALPRLTTFLQALVDGGGEKAEATMRQHRERYGWPLVTRHDDKIRHYQPVLLPARYETLGEDFQPVKRGTALWEAWEALRIGCSWPPLPDDGKQEWFLMPPISADAVDLDEAVAAAIEAFRRRVEGEHHAAAE